ncbi:hypothetical protein L9F63_007479, partial [Diploptera punctata]
MLVFVALTIILHVIGQTSKLNVPRVLLPIFQQINTNFTLKVRDEGCYKWSTSRIDLIQLISPNPENIFTDCTNSIVVSAITKEQSRNTAIVFAEDQNSGLIFRCDIILDIITSLNIVTTTRKLFMEEAPEAFEVQAYDDQGNQFTTLEGVEFQWIIGNWNTHQYDSGSGILRFITFKDSPYETPPTIQIFDEIGKQGHIVLLEGIKTGSAKVLVRLPQIEYRHVPSFEIGLSVVANLIIDPADIYLLKGDSVKYCILQVHQGRLEEIQLPSSQYYLEVENTNIASIDVNTHVLTGLVKGKTEVLLRDKNVEEKEAGVRISSSTVTVSSPYYLNLAILPHRNRILIIEDHYEIVVEIYDKEDHKFYIGEDVVMSVTIPQKYFHVERSTANNTHHYGLPIKVGAAPVSAALEGIMNNGYLEPLTKISAKIELLIYKRITIYPCEQIFHCKFSILIFELTLKASGGDGNFIWSSGNTTVAVVMQNGLMKTYGLGHTEIFAAMTHNPHKKAVAKVFVLPAIHLEIVEYMLETEIGSPLYIHVALFAERPKLESTISSKNSMIPFFHCNDLPLLVEVWNSNFKNSSLKITPVGIACTTVAIIGTSLGTSKVSVTYTLEDKTMSADALVATYSPLVVTHPESAQTVLAIGTSREVAFAGGPRPWIGRSPQHTHHVTLEGDEQSIEVVELDNKSDLTDMYIYRVICRELGEVDLTLHVANQPSLRHSKKSESTATLRILCARPRYVELKSELKVSEPSNCPMNLNAEKIVTQSYCDVELLVTVKDTHGQIFDNVTSLYFDWKLSHPALASIQEKDSIIELGIEEDGITIPYKNYQILKPKGRTGVIEVIASIVAYQNTMLTLMDIVPEDPPFAISDERGLEIKASLRLILVNDTIITPNHTTVFNHPRNKAILQINQGSGYYDFVLSTEVVADINYIESARIIEVIPKSDGTLWLGLRDLCLQSKPAYAEIQVIDLGNIKLEVSDRVQKGQCVTAIVRLYDTSDNLLPTPNPEFLNLLPLPESGIIGVKLQPVDKKTVIPLGEIWYVVTGLELGDTILKFSASEGKRDVQSNSVHIQVFPSLKLVPHNVTLIVGSSFQISSRGGPRPDANVEYDVSTPDVANVSLSGVITGVKQGSTIITGRAMGTNKVTGNRVIFSQDSIEVHVIPLKGIRIHTPLKRIRTGATMPIWADGIPDMLTPLIIGALNPPLKFKWSSSALEVGDIKHVYSDYELDLDEEDMISMRFTAMNSGHTFLKLEVQVPDSITDSTEDTFFRDTMEIEVFEELLLTHPPYPAALNSPLILLAPYSEVELQTNRDGLAQEVIYSLGGAMMPYENTSFNYSLSTVLVDANKFLTVEPNGLVKSHGKKGRGVIMIVAKEPFGIQQILSVTVIVKQIHYIMLTVQKKVRVLDDERLEIIPRGFELQFQVSYHDSTGSVFTSTSSHVRQRTNRFDFVQLQSGKTNQSLIANMIAAGDTMLKVWDDQTPTQSADFVKITSGEVIYPEKMRMLLVGDIICFTLPLSSLDGVHGKWETSNNNILTLDSSIGLGKVQAPGKVIVKYLLNSLFTFTELEALPVSSIKFLEPSNRTLINVKQIIPFRVPVILCNSKSTEKTGNLITRNKSCPFDYLASSFPFICELRFDSPVADVDIQDVFVVYQDFDIKDEIYSRDVSPVIGKHRCM